MKKKPGGAYEKPQLDTFTVWGNPNERFLSQYGLMTYKQWCEKEIERIGKLGRVVVIRTASDGEIALAEVSEDVGSKDNMQQESVGGVSTLP